MAATLALLSSPIDVSSALAKEISMTIRAGFIGLGSQGKPIAAHLAPTGGEAAVGEGRR